MADDATNRNAVLVLSKIANALETAFPRIFGTAATATGGVKTLPANPQGFIKTTLQDGTEIRIPYYNP